MMQIKFYLLRDAMIRVYDIVRSATLALLLISSHECIAKECLLPNSSGITHTITLKPTTRDNWIDTHTIISKDSKNLHINVTGELSYTNTQQSSTSNTHHIVGYVMNLARNTTQRISNFLWKEAAKTNNSSTDFTTTTSNECILDSCFLNGDPKKCILKNKVIEDNSIGPCVLKNGIGIVVKAVPNNTQYVEEDVKIFLLKLNSNQQMLSLQDISLPNTYLGDFKLYMRIIGDPNTLTGEYHVKIHEEEKKYDGIFFKPLFEHTKNIISKSSKNISDSLSSSPILQRTFLAIVSIYVSLSGFLFSTGILNHKASDLLKHYLKICCICALADVDTITYLIDLARTLCIDGSQAIADMIMDVSIKISSNLFKSDIPTSMLEVYDSMLSSYFSFGFHKRLWSLFFTKYMIYIPIAYITVCVFIMACIRSAILYLISIVGFSLLFAISPIMLCLLFSKPSKDLFNAWTRCITNCALINIFLSIALGIFAVVMFQYNTSPFEYIICNNPLNILHSQFFSYSIDLWKPYNNAISITIMDIITDLLVVSLFKYTIDSVPSMVESIAPSIYNPLSDAGNVIYNITNMAEVPISAPSFAAYNAYKYPLSKATTSILNIISRNAITLTDSAKYITTRPLETTQDTQADSQTQVNAS